MRTLVLLAVSAAYASAQMEIAQHPVVEFQMMTWAEVKKAIHEDGFINAVVYNGGTEQRGPQNVNGGHNLMAQQTARAIALKMGHTIVAPVMPYSPNTASADLPGTIPVSEVTFKAVNMEVAEGLITSGFKNIFLMGDHGGGQKQLGEVAKELDAKYSAKGVHVYFCDEMYDKAQNDYWKWLETQKLPSWGHAGIMDTSEMLYLGGDKGWVRTELIPSALGDPSQAPGSPRVPRDASKPRINNGITGDARPSTPDLGKRIFDMKVDYAVNQMKRFLAAQTSH
jgi:creatinine amidohydrolase/Fe(II)-dependent formamide hydrolase-like protein